MTSTELQASEFGRQLRRWRRQRGLSQLELATRAGTTPRHVSFLETGRSRPRIEMVLRLAGELDLLPREQNALLEAAGLRPVFPQRSLEHSDMARFRQVIEALLEAHKPLPAAVIDRYGAVRSANKAFEGLTPGLVGLEPEELVDRFFGPGPLRAALVNWEEVASAWLARQQFEARPTADPRLEALIARAEQLIGPLPPRIGRDELPVVHSRIKAGDDVLELFTVAVRFDTAIGVTLSELRVELMYRGTKRPIGSSGWRSQEPDGRADHGPPGECPPPRGRVLQPVTQHAPPTG